MIQQIEFSLRPYSRGFHLITHDILQAVGNLPATGILSVFIQHTSAGLTINENADFSVRDDMEYIFNQLAPENQPEYTHVMEGLDDMPAHIKATLTGSSVTIPITDGELNMGVWQGIYLCEFRNHGSSRSLVATVYS